MMKVIRVLRSGAAAGSWAEGAVQFIAALAIVLVMLLGGLGRAGATPLPTDGGVYTLIHPWVVQTECGDRAVTALVVDGSYRVDQVEGYAASDCHLVAVYGIMPGFVPGEYAWTFANTGIVGIGRAPEGEYARPGTPHPHVTFEINHAVGTVAVSIDLDWLFSDGSAASLSLGLRSGADRATQVYAPEITLVDNRRLVAPPAGQNMPFRPHLQLPDDGGNHELLAVTRADVRCPNGGGGSDIHPMQFSGGALEAPPGISRVHHADCMVYMEWRPVEGYWPADVLDSFVSHDGLASIVYPDGTDYIRLSSRRPDAAVGVYHHTGIIYLWIGIEGLMRGQQEVAVGLSTRHGNGQTIIAAPRQRILFYW